MSARKYPAKAITALRVMHHARYSYPRMADDLNKRWPDDGIRYNATCCRDLLRREGIMTKLSETWRDEVVELLKTMYWDGLSYTKIAAALAAQFGGKYTNETVSRAVERRSFERNPDREREIDRDQGMKKPKLTVEKVNFNRLGQLRPPEATQAAFPSQRYPVPPGGFSMLRGAL
tara:strand:+ start:1020 stop:1544 length:525 start_codon:yes stop_codon:yes gene_type:complete